jgi:hypothetical protein
MNSDRTPRVHEEIIEDTIEDKETFYIYNFLYTLSKRVVTPPLFDRLSINSLYEFLYPYLFN